MLNCDLILMDYDVDDGKGEFPMPYDSGYFQQTLGREFVTAFEGVVDLEDLSISECLQVLFNRFGMEFDIEVIKALGQEDLTRLTSEFNDYFEVEGITDKMVESALTQAIWHWTE